MDGGQEGARVTAGAPGQEPVPFDGWVEVRGPALLRLAYILTGNTADAEDVVQEALARALPRWDRISRVDNLDAYVRRMVVNAHTSWWRKFRRRESPVAEPRESAVEGPRGGVRRPAPALAGLPERCRSRSAPRSCCATTSSWSTPRSPS